MSLGGLFDNDFLAVDNIDTLLVGFVHLYAGECVGVGIVLCHLHIVDAGGLLKDEGIGRSGKIGVVGLVLRDDDTLFAAVEANTLVFIGQNENFVTRHCQGLVNGTFEVVVGDFSHLVASGGEEEIARLANHDDRSIGGHLVLR